MQMLKLKERLLDEIEVTRKEDRCLTDYRSEMEMLIQEKMAHVEELRQIHADINAVCEISLFPFNPLNIFVIKLCILQIEFKASSL